MATMPKLPRRKKKERRSTHAHLLHIPSSTWIRMLKAGVVSGEVTEYIVAAIEQRLDRDWMEGEDICLLCNDTRKSHADNRRGHDFVNKEGNR